MIRIAFFAAAAAALAATPAAAHDWYSGLRSNNGVSCCSGDHDTGDCHPTSYCTLPGGKEGMVIQGACRAIPRDKVIGTPSPDGQPHECSLPPFPGEAEPRIFCLIEGGGA